MIEKLDDAGLQILEKIINQIENKRKRRFIEYFIVRIINNSDNTTASINKIKKIVDRDCFDENLLIENLALLYENENNEKLNRLCSFYND